jgi:hypothetical protein
MQSSDSANARAKQDMGSRATLHRCRDALLEVKLTLTRLQNSTAQRRLHSHWVALETTQDELSPTECLYRAEALRLEVADLYTRRGQSQT